MHHILRKLEEEGLVCQRIAEHAKHRADIRKSRSHVHRAEKHPADHHDHQHQRMGDQRHTRHDFRQAGQLFDHQKDEIIQAPQHKGPVRAVPKTGQQPDDQQIQHHTRTAPAITAQGDIDIITEPLRQRHMPAPPEIRHRIRYVGIIKVLQEMEAKHPPQTDRHIGIAAEIKVYLQRIGQRTDPRRTDRDRLISAGIEYLIRHDGEIIGQQHFLGQTDDKQLDTRHEILPVLPPPGNLGRYGIIPHDRACDQLREEGDIQADIQHVFTLFRLAAPDIDDIRNTLKDKKRYTDRQHHLRHRQ